MGKGLSPLQREILILALHNREQRGASTGRGADVYYAEVLHKHFKWPFAVTHWHVFKESGNAGVLDAQRESPGSKVFSKDEIGEQKYNSDMAALSRSMLRLSERGLVVCLRGGLSKWAGADLTNAGVEAAKGLTVK